MTGALLLVGAAVLLLVGAELFVENSSGAARRMGLTVLAVGLLLAGAEPEEALTGVLASAAGRPELAAGDAIGANVTMLTAALGLAALARPLPVHRRVRVYAVGAAAAGVLAVLALADGTVTRPEGAALLAAYAGLVALVWWREREPPAIGELAELDELNELAEDAEDEDAETEDAETEDAETEDAETEDAETAGTGGDGRRTGALWRPLLLAFAGIAVMAGGGWLAVEGAERVVAALGVTDSAVGLTALALATTAELFALVVAAVRRGVPEVAVAGMVGSAAYNATVSLGLAATVSPLAVTGILPSALAAAVLPLLVLALSPRGRLGRTAGGLLTLGYVGYVVIVLRG